MDSRPIHIYLDRLGVSESGNEVRRDSSRKQDEKGKKGIRKEREEERKNERKKEAQETRKHS